VADPAGLPLIATPPYPDHPSGLGCLGGAHASTLRDVFGTDHASFTITSLASGTTRSFGSFSQALDEIVDARVYSGIHFRAVDVQGARMGERIARAVARRRFGPRPHGFVVAPQLPSGS